jgi:predicted Zn-dependent protease
MPAATVVSALPRAPRNRSWERTAGSSLQRKSGGWRLRGASDLVGGLNIGVRPARVQATAQSPAQLATVLRHEVGHVKARHGAERVVTEHFITLALRLVAALLALGDVRIPPDLLVALGASATELGIVRPFSRAQELEADARAGYEPTEAVAFWRRMQQLAGDGGPPAFLATHPSSARRIEELLEQLPEIRTGA